MFSDWNCECSYRQLKHTRHVYVQNMVKAQTLRMSVIVYLIDVNDYDVTTQKEMNEGSVCAAAV